VLAGEVADATTEGDAPEADGASIAERDDEVVLLRLLDELARHGAGLGPGRLVLGVDADFVKAGHIDDQTVIDDAVAGDAVAAGADGKGKAVAAGESDTAADIGGVDDTDDDGGLAVDCEVLDGAGIVVVGVTGEDDLALDAEAEGGPRLGRKMWQCGGDSHGWLFSSSCVGSRLSSARRTNLATGGGREDRSKGGDAGPGVEHFTVQLAGLWERSRAQGIRASLMAS